METNQAILKKIMDLMSEAGIIDIDINDGPETVRYTDNHGMLHHVSLKEDK